MYLGSVHRVAGVCGRGSLEISIKDIGVAARRNSWGRFGRGCCGGDESDVLVWD